MKENTKKFGPSLAALMLALLLVGTLVFAPCLVSADDGGGVLIQDPSSITRDGPPGEPLAPPPSWPGPGNILFEQLPYDPWSSTYTSDADIVPGGYLCMDDFWGLTGSIGDIHWWGLSGFYDGWWFYDCDPTGMEFEIIFYQDAGGSPGAPVATFSNVTPTITYLYTNELSAYRFDIPNLGTPVSLTEGWVSIQSTSSPNGCSFLWITSPSGNGNAMQSGDSIGVNLAFALTERGLDFGDAPEGALAYPATGVIGAFPTCKDVTIAGWVQHDNFGAWFGPSFDREFDGNAGLCPGFAPYDSDECYYGDGDAGLIMPGAYTIQSGIVTPCGSSCEYSICLVDTWGDGWNGGTVDVFVNGNPVYTGLTLASGWGPECHPIPVRNGDEITVDWTGGGWPYENEYYIYDSHGVLVRSEGVGGVNPGDVLPGELLAGCPSGGMGGTPLGSPCGWAHWGHDIDILIHNWMPNHEPYLPAYVNVLIDWNQDGQWQNDPGTTCDGSIVPEHVLVDFLIPPQYDGTLSTLLPPSFQIGPNDGYVWARFSITEVPVGSDWNGEGSFEDGETEDYLLRVYQPPPVGGEAYPANKASLLAPWIALGGAVMVGVGVFVLRRRRA